MVFVVNRYFRSTTYGYHYEVNYSLFPDSPRLIVANNHEPKWSLNTVRHQGSLCAEDM